MIGRLNHVAIAVPDLEAASAQYRDALGAKVGAPRDEPDHGVTVVFIDLPNTKIELLEATAPESAIAKYVEKRGEGIHHIAFEVEDIYAEMERMRAQGYQLLNDQPKRGADNKLVCFIHPKTANGVLVELCQTIRE